MKNTLFLSALFCFLFSSCEKHNNKKAKISYDKTNKYYILKLFGKRSFMVHDLKSISNQDVYSDSGVFILKGKNITNFNGHDIKVEKGYYEYKGYVRIDTLNNIVNVNLKYINTDDNKLDPCIWNGVYYYKDIVVK